MPNPFMFPVWALSPYIHCCLFSLHTHCEDDLLTGTNRLLFACRKALSSPYSSQPLLAGQVLQLPNILEVPDHLKFISTLTILRKHRMAVSCVWFVEYSGKEHSCFSWHPMLLFPNPRMLPAPAAGCLLPVAHQEPQGCPAGHCFLAQIGCKGWFFARWGIWYLSVCPCWTSWGLSYPFFQPV